MFFQSRTEFSGLNDLLQYLIDKDKEEKASKATPKKESSRSRAQIDSNAKSGDLKEAELQNVDMVPKICISFDGDHKSSDERDVGKTTRTTSSKLPADEAVVNIDTKDSHETSHNGIETKGEGQDIPITDPTCPVCFRYSISKKS